MKKNDACLSGTLAAREARVRRLANKQGLRLHKSSSRDECSPLFGTYMLVEADTGFLHFGDTNSGYGCTLEDIEAWLTDVDPFEEGVFSAEAVCMEMTGAEKRGEGDWIVQSTFGYEFRLSDREMTAVMESWSSGTFDPCKHSRVYWDPSDLELDGTCGPRFE